MLCPNCGMQWAPFSINGKKMTEEERKVVFYSPKKDYCSPDCDDEHRQRLQMEIQREVIMDKVRRFVPEFLEGES